MAAPASALVPLTDEEDEWLGEFVSSHRSRSFYLMDQLSDARIQLLLRVTQPTGRVLLDYAAYDYVDGTLDEILDEILDDTEKEIARRASILPDLPGGMTRFPIQPWEREMHAWMVEQDLAHQRPHLTWDQLVQLYETSVAVRHPNVVLSLERLHANAVVFAHSRTGDHFYLGRYFVDEFQKINGPGTAIWHYAVERIDPRLLAEFRAGLNRIASFGTVHDARVYQIARPRIIGALVKEEQRRALLRTSGHDRANLAQSGLVDFMSTINPSTERHRGGRDAAQIVGQYHSALITPRRTPFVPHTGPIRSNADVLEEIAEEARTLAAAAAAAANPEAAAAAAIAGLERVTSQVTWLAESVAKRHKH